jgi:Putative peptidoglycan binding domain
MRFSRTWQAILLGILLLATPAFATRTHRAATAGHSHHYVHHRYRHHRYAHRHVVRGQRGIEPERAQQIQEALIKAHYLNGSASGQWDAATQAAMEKYQADHGWQTKLVPDSRALIALGLGPKVDKTLPVPGTAVPAAATTTDASLPAPVPGTLADTHSLPN